MGAPYTSLAVANALLEIAERVDNKRLTNLVLQKLVYFAHGWYLGLAHTPLVCETCQSWRYGPVFQYLYEALRKYGAGEVTEEIETFDKVEKDSEDYQFLERLYDQYGGCSAGELIAITHNPGSPWEQMGAGKIPYKEIPNSIIEEFYSKLAKENASKNKSDSIRARATV